MMARKAGQPTIRSRPLRGAAARAGSLIAALGMIGGSSGCRERAAEAQAPPPPMVTVIEAKAMDVPIEVKTTGITTAEKEVTIRARVQGFLQEQDFREGQNVEPGQLLFVIDEAPFQARLEMAQGQRDEAAAALEQAKNSKAVGIAAAQLAVSQAQLYFAQIEENRSSRLLQRNAVTREEYDQRKAELQQAQADVQAKQASLDQARVTFDSDIALAQARLTQAEADLTQAKLNLGYCRMSSPIAGRIGEAQIEVGNYVGSVGQVQADPLSATPLATIQQLDPIEVEIRPSARYLAESTALAEQGLAVRLIVEGEREHPYEGRVRFIDNTVDTSTSTFLVKAVVPNPEESLLPGQYVQVLMTIGVYQGVVVVPEKAVVETQAGPVVYIVDSENRVAARPVTALDTYKGLRVIDSGLEPGEKVVIEGLQMARPGTQVRFEVAEYGPRETETTTDQESRRRRRQAVLDSIRNGAAPAPSPGSEATPTPKPPGEDAKAGDAEAPKADVDTEATKDAPPTESPDAAPAPVTPGSGDPTP